MPEPPAAGPVRSRDGHVVTFYSYKGGTGRTMALANVAWILAANGRRVLVADWDLESPGLHRFYHPFLADSEVQNAPGIVDLIRSYVWTASKTEPPGRDAVIRDSARVQHYAISLDWNFPDGGSLDLLPAGRQNANYLATLAALDWDHFYDSLSGGEFLDAIRTDMKQHYDYVLIDSRSGLSDVADICTVQMPDTLVDCFTLSTQSIEGAAQVARLVAELHPSRAIRILPVPMRVDPSEKERADAGRTFATRAFAGLPTDLSDAARREYWATVEVPYRAYYSYEETLAVFDDAPGSPASLLASFERLTAHLTTGEVIALPRLDEQLRHRTRRLFARGMSSATDTIVLEFAPEDQLWAEWIAGVLKGARLSVRERRLAGADEPDQPEGGDHVDRRLAVVTAAYVARQAHRTAESPPDLAVYITAGGLFTDFATTASAVLAGVSEREAAERVFRLIGVPGLAGEDIGGGLVRYPGAEPRIDIMPARNPRFTGRETELRRLREQLRDSGTAILSPVSLHGLGGVGKTQLALEYAYRFKADYDLVWWVNCGQPQFIDASIADLAERFRDAFAIAEPVPGDITAASRQVLEMLSTGDPAQRWLLVYDNAEDIDAVLPHLPTGGGQVLITSRNRAWADQARSVSVDVFTRAESTAHLRSRVPSLSEGDANRVAEALGDLPLAVSAAGAWLAETGVTVSDYLDALGQQGHRVLSASPVANYPIPLGSAWDLSLNRLRERSPAAARLFELCSVMAPSIASELLFSHAMAGVLAPYDAALSEPILIGRLVQEINRLALITLDTEEGEVHVHQLVQAVVRDRMSDEDLSEARLDVHRVLAATRPDRSVDNPETWPRFRAIWPHLRPSSAESSAEEPVRQLCIDRVRYLWQIHDLDRASAEAAELDARWTGMLAKADGPAADSLHRQLLNLRSHRASNLRDQGQAGEALVLNEAVLAAQRELLGETHPHTLITAGGLAADLRSGGRYAEALSMDETTYLAWVEMYGEEYSETLAAASSLAASYRFTGDFPTALRIDEETLLRRRATSGPTHPRTLDSGVAVARDLLGSGRYAEAITLIRNVCQQYADALGPSTFAALNARALLGISLRRAGQYQDAISHLLDASNGLARESGQSSSEALACQLAHALTAVITGRPRDAEATVRRVLAGYMQRRGPRHPDTLACQVDLARVLHATGLAGAALEVADPAAQALREIVGGSHPYSLAASMALGALLAVRGDLADAEHAEAEAAAGLAAALGDQHPDTLRCRANLLLTRQQRGQASAGPERTQAVGRLADLIGQNHPDVVILRREQRLMPELDPEPC